MKLHRLFLVLLTAAMSFAAALAAEPKVDLLWPAGAPGAKGDQPADKPTLTIYLADPEKANGAAVVICPGGGYGNVAMDHEGHQIAQWFNSFGASGFILDYRHSKRGYGHPVHPVGEGTPTHVALPFAPSMVSTGAAGVSRATRRSRQGRMKAGRWKPMWISASRRSR